MVASLVKEDSNSGTSCLEQLAELVHCMVFRFPGFPDLYEPVMEAIKVSDHPPLLPCPTLTGVPVWALLKAILQVSGSTLSSGPGCLPSPPLAHPVLWLGHLPFPRLVMLSHDCSEPLHMLFSPTVNPSLVLPRWLLRIL